jgi:hypothetical protein
VIEHNLIVQFYLELILPNLKRLCLENDGTPWLSFVNSRVIAPSSVNSVSNSCYSDERFATRIDRPRKSWIIALFFFFRKMPFKQFKPDWSSTSQGVLSVSASQRHRECYQWVLLNVTGSVISECFLTSQGVLSVSASQRHRECDQWVLFAQGCENQYENVVRMKSRENTFLTSLAWLLLHHRSST